jgi:hypothetical protein
MILWSRADGNSYSPAVADQRATPGLFRRPAGIPDRPSGIAIKRTRCRAMSSQQDRRIAAFRGFNGMRCGSGIEPGLGRHHEMAAGLLRPSRRTTPHSDQAVGIIFNRVMECAYLKLAVIAAGLALAGLSSAALGREGSRIRTMAGRVQSRRPRESRVLVFTLIIRTRRLRSPGRSFRTRKPASEACIVRTLNGTRSPTA